MISDFGRRNNVTSLQEFHVFQKMYTNIVYIFKNKIVIP